MLFLHLVALLIHVIYLSFYPHLIPSHSIPSHISLSQLRLSLSPLSLGPTRSSLSLSAGGRAARGGGGSGAFPATHTAVWFPARQLRAGEPRRRARQSAKQTPVPFTRATRFRLETKRAVLSVYSSSSSWPCPTDVFMQSLSFDSPTTAYLHSSPSWRKGSIHDTQRPESHHVPGQADEWQREERNCTNDGLQNESVPWCPE